MENNFFSYSYSASRYKEVESIRRKYLPREESKMRILKKLDSRVQSAGIIESLCLGITGSLVFGVGMCFFLGVFTPAPVLSAIMMILGSVMMLPAYPIYRHIASKTKAQLTPEILRLSEEIING